MPWGGGSLCILGFNWWLWEIIELHGSEAELRWWLETLTQRRDLSLKQRGTTASISTDASDKAIGYVVEGEGWHKEGNRPVSNAYSHINTKELEALLVCLEREGEALENQRIIWYSDNMTARAAIRRQGTQNISQEAWETTKKILDILEEKNITIIAKHVPGSMNKKADALSRGNIM